MLHKIRLWLIRKLIGKMPVILNAKIKDGVVYMRGEMPVVKRDFPNKYTFDGCVIRGVSEKLWRGGRW